MKKTRSRKSRDTVPLRGSRFQRPLESNCARIYRPSFHENKPKTLVFNDCKRAENERVGVVFAKTGPGSMNSGTVLKKGNTAK
jgi:hypothetical protein